MNASIAQIMADIRLVVFDVDGVLTDGKLYFTADGNEFKAFNSQDGHGIKMLHNAGILTAIITGRTSKIVTKRASDLGIKYVQQGREDKLIALKQLLAQINFNLTQTAYMGDDLPDLLAIKAAALGVAPFNAVNAVKQAADFVTNAKGGSGAVRELCDLILQHKLNA